MIEFGGSVFEERQNFAALSAQEEGDFQPL